MLEGEAVKSLGIVNGCQCYSRPTVLQGGKYFLPNIYQHMGPTAAFHTPILIKFTGNFLPCPIQYVRLHDLTNKLRAGDVPEVREGLGTACLRDDGNEFCLPVPRPGHGGRNLVEDGGEGDGQEVGELRYKVREEIPTDH